MKNKITLIIAREYNQRVRKKSFIITTLLMPVLMAALMILPAMMAMHEGTENYKIVVIDSSGAIADKLANSQKVEFVSTTESYEDAEKNYSDAFGFLLIGEDIINNPSDLKLYTRKNSTIDMENDITRQISSIVENERIAKTQIEGLEQIMEKVKARGQLTTFVISENQQGKSSSSIVSMMVGYIGGFMMYMFVLMYGAFIMQGVIEEKNSRIVEVIISSVKPFQLMMGKILGVALVALTQLFVWIVLIGAIYTVASSMIFAGVDAQSGDFMAAAAQQGINPDFATIMSTLANPSYLMKILGCYLIYFVGGYLLYSSMYAAVGSAVDNIQDAQQLNLPITIPLILAIIVMINAMRVPDSAISFWFSIIPFTSPIVMMARIPYGVPAWEIILSVVLLYTTFVGVVWFSAKIYRVGILMYGKKPTLKELIKWARYKN